MIDIASIGLLLRWALVTAGIIYFVTESSIFAPARMALARGGFFLKALVYCRACFGFWAGCGLGLAGFWPFGAQPWLESGFAAMALGAVWSHWMPNHAYHTEQSMTHELRNGDADVEEEESPNE